MTALTCAREPETPLSVRETGSADRQASGCRGGLAGGLEQESGERTQATRSARRSTRCGPATGFAGGQFSTGGAGWW